MMFISYWILPVISGLVWLGTLLGLLLSWTLSGRPRYRSMSDNQSIAYISDVGAYELKPLFITGCCIAAVFLDLGFAADRWLRHRGRLVPNVTRAEKVLSGLTIFFAGVGTVGLILLSVFDTADHDRLHDIFLLFFIAGYLLSAVFICWEYQRLGIKWREHRILRLSFWIKLVFVMLELVLAVAFIATTWTRRYDVGACLEWAIGFIFSLYIFSFVVDLYPAIFTKPAGSRFFKPASAAGKPTAVHQMEMGQASTSTADGPDGSLPVDAGHVTNMDRVPNNF